MNYTADLFLTYMYIEYTLNFMLLLLLSTAKEESGQAYSRNRFRLEKHDEMVVVVLKCFPLTLSSLERKLIATKENVFFFIIISSLSFMESSLNFGYGE